MSCSVSDRLSIICFSHCRNNSSGAKGDNNIHGKQVQCFLAFCCLILFAVACCGRISSPIFLRLCSELLAHELLFVMNYKKGLIVCLLLAC